jgi:hypothetical protein
VTRVTFHDDGSMSRRGVLRLGGLTVAMAAVVAACSNTEAGNLGRVGLAPSTTKLPDVTYTDVTLLRTCSSLQHSLLDLYNSVKDDPELLDPVNRPLVLQLIADAQSTAKTFEGLTVERGGEVWACGNTKFDSALIEPAMKRITVGAPATPEAKAIPPSDDKRRDVLNLVQGMESIISATYQQYTALVNDLQLRVPMISAGARGARHAAHLALVINPGGYVSKSDEQAAEISTDTVPGGSTTTTVAQNLGNTTTSSVAGAAGPQLTEIPAVYALPSTFGTTSTITVVVGAGDENGTRLKVLLETPSLNSMEYEALGPCS